MSICLYKQDSRTYDVTVVSDGITLQFNPDSSFKRVAPGIIPDGSFRQVDIVSILQYHSGVEVASIVGENFTKFKSTKTANNVINAIWAANLRILFLGTRKITMLDDTVMQYILIIPKMQLANNQMVERIVER